MTDHSEIRRLYIEERISPDEIGRRFGISGRRIRQIMAKAGIPRLGSGHLRKGKSAEWNIGVVRSAETRERLRLAGLGRPSHNKGCGNAVFECIACGVSVSDKPYRRKNYCSKLCQSSHMMRARGEDHFNHKGSIAGHRQRARGWAEIREWRAQVLKDCNYTCQKCKTAGGRLTAHHLASWSGNPTLRFLVANGVALCWPCHWSFHREYGLRNNTAEQYKVWITKN